MPQVHLSLGMGVDLHPLGLVEHLSAAASTSLHHRSLDMHKDGDDDGYDAFLGVHGPAGSSFPGLSVSARAPLHKPLTHSHMHLHLQMQMQMQLPGLASFDADSGGSGASAGMHPFGSASIGASGADSPPLHGSGRGGSAATVAVAHAASTAAAASGHAAASSVELDLQLDQALLSPAQHPGPPQGPHRFGSSAAAAAAPPSPAASGAAAASGSQARLPAGWGKPRPASAAKPADVDSWFA